LRKSEEYRRALRNVVHEAMMATINVPADDRFQIVTEHAPNDFIVDDKYLGIALGTAVCLALRAA
jgi:hypothetical protein